MKSSQKLTYVVVEPDTVSSTPVLLDSMEIILPDQPRKMVLPKWIRQHNRRVGQFGYLGDMWYTQ